MIKMNCIDLLTLAQVNRMEEVAVTEKQFWEHFHTLIDEKGWSVREEDNGSIRLARPKRKNHDFCPITAVYFDIEGGKPLLTTQAEMAAKGLEIGPRVMNRIIKLADEEGSYPNARPAWLARLGLRLT